MSVRTLLVSVGLLVTCGGAHSQPQPPSSIPPQNIPVPAPAPSLQPPSVPPEKSVDDLIGELERLRAQKAELEKKEQELLATLRKKLQAQTERLQKLGVAPKEAKPETPDRVGRITIEGNAEKDEKKILDAIGLRPGQILQYPTVEAARTKLEKLGFKAATVEVIPSDPDSPFKDIRVRVGEIKR